MTATQVEYRLDDRYLRQNGTILLTGVQALARLPIEQLRRDIAVGLRTAAFLSGYPGSPLAGFDLEVSRALKLVPDLPIVHTPALNEELAATSVMGTQFVAGRGDKRVDGVTGYWYGKAPGVDRASDALRHAVFAGTGRSSGAIALVGDDPANKSSTLPSSSAAALVGLGMPLFYPGNVAECIELGLHAVAASRATGLWSAMKIITPVGDGSSTIDASDFGGVPLIPTMSVNGQLYECVPSGRLLGARLLDIEREIYEIRTPLAREYGILNGLNRISVDPPDAWIGMIASGYTYYELLHALERVGLRGDRAIADAGIRLLHLRMPVPFDPDLIRRFADGLDEVLVLEDKDDTVESRVRDALYSASHRPLVTGKRTPAGMPLVPSWGLLDAVAIEPAIRARLERKLDARLTPVPVPRERVMIPLTVARSPFFCSGCPHNWSTKVPDDAEVGAGIGCSTMVLMMDEERVGHSIGITAMGNEGAQWTGMRPFIEADHIFQNLGDGTFFHSGQLAIQHAVSAGNHITFKLLYNGTVAMTGGQTSPGMRSVAEIATTLLGQGVACVAITTDEPEKYRRVRLPHGVKVHKRDEIVAVQAALRNTPGVTVLIHDQACAAETRRLRRRGTTPTPTHRVLINERVCEGCGDCGQVSNCLSVQPVETPFGRKTTIDQASCNLDFSCLGGDCPAFMTVESTSTRRDAAGRSPVTPTPLPATTLLDAGDSYRIRLVGIGGTGVITSAQILSTAAMLDGWQCSGLDQTGLSQKAGPVVSDLVLTRGSEATSNHIGPAEADLILAFDALTAAADTVIAAGDPDRTVVIASTHRTPTGSMVTSPGIAYPDQSTLTARLEERSRSGLNRYIDAWALSSDQLGSGNYSNTVLLGAAVQSTALPVALDSIIQAIRLNGTEVDRNLEAFELGRRAVLRSDSAAGAPDGCAAGDRAVDTIVDATVARRLEDVVEDTAHRALIGRLATDLIGYQDRRYARRYLDHVAAAATAETTAIGAPGTFTVAVARNLHKVMAYKDEYEVARLMLLPDTRRQVESLGGPEARFAWHLHPPMLRSLGLHRKITISSRASVVFRLLRTGRRVRGKWADPFGYAHHRRSERRLIEEYQQSLHRMYAVLSPATIADAIEAAELPDGVRGYGELKERRIAEYRSAMRESLEQLEHVPRVSPESACELHQTT